MRDAFQERHGFARRDATLANWRTAPYSRWSFWNVAELVPSASVPAPASAREGNSADASGLLGERLDIGAGAESVAAFLARSHGDALTVMKDGRFVADWHAPGASAGGRHVVFSISKSLTAILAGALAEDGLLDPEAPISTYLPVPAGSAYADATVRHLLDMRVGVDFEEAYLDPASAFARYRRAMLWNPPEPGQPVEDLASMILALPPGGLGHGGPFRYRSPNSDLLGAVVERASGVRYADLLAERLWRPLGARTEGLVTVDAIGFARAAGGVSMTARDLARVGEMMRRDGEGETGRVVPAAWVRDTLTGGDRAAWRAGDFAHLFTDGAYRNKWYATGYGDGSFAAIGIHGQWLYVAPRERVVIAKFASQPLPSDNALDLEELAFFRMLAEMV